MMLDFLLWWFRPSVFTLTAFVIGFSGIRFRRVPVVAGGLLCVGYLVILVCTGIWAATCLDCNAGELRRDATWVIGAAVYTIFLAVLLLTIAFGALSAWVVRKAFLRG